MGVTVVVDSTADLPSDVVAKHGIRVVPLNVHFGAESYRDGVDLEPAEFYRRLRAASSLPTTSQPSVGAFREVYESAPPGDGIVSIHLAGNLSGTLQAATLAAAECGREVRLVDSGTVTLALGFLAIAAATAGGDLDRAEAAARERVPRAGILAVMDTLRYAVMGGRVSKLKGALGGMLSIKPMLGVHLGEVDQVGVGRNMDNALTKLESMLEREGELESLAVVHSDNEAAARDLHARVSARHPGLSVLLAGLGPVVGTHAGPGAVGVAFVRTG
ncbi:MAG: DegV family protein [Candidatus Dormibacteria bacterium]